MNNRLKPGKWNTSFHNKEAVFLRSWPLSCLDWPWHKVLSLTICFSILYGYVLPFCLFTLRLIRFPFASAGINRVSQGGVSYFNLKTEQFSYLNITRIGSELVQDGSECGFSCLEASLCFSYNLATFSDVNGKLQCELLPSDKYNNSDKFIYSPIFNHVSILVGANLFVVRGIVCNKFTAL